MVKTITLPRKDFEHILKLLGTFADVLGDESRNPNTKFRQRQLAKSGHFGVKKVIAKYENF